MALRAVYERFLASVNPQDLDDGASLNYITTLTTFREPEAIIKHLTSQNKSVARKKSENILSAVEGPSSLSLDVETTFEFSGAGGGSYLPTLDGNFLADKTVTLLSIHIVQFTSANKIQHIRIYWDQGALLKQVDVIGSRGRNWPIYDNKDQSRLVKSTIANAPTSAQTTSNARSRDPEEVVITTRSTSPSKKHIRDPHASLSLFDPPEPEKPLASPAVAARQSAKPPPRDMSELFFGGEPDMTNTESAAPTKTAPESVLSPKGAGGKKFAANRLFEEDPDAVSPAKYKSDPRKYSHFDLGNGEEGSAVDAKVKESSATKPISLRPKSVKQSHWDFEDFSTPDKPRAKARAQDVRHFGWSDDEGELAGSPGKNPRIAQPRRDAETHFEFQDDGTPAGAKPFGRPKGQAHNTGLGLYQNNLWEDGLEQFSVNEDFKQPLSTLPNGVNRKKDFGHSWDYMDESPVDKNKGANENKPIAEDRMKAVKMMDASWNSYDKSPDQKNTRQPKPDRKGSERHWGFGDEDVEEPRKPAKKQEAPKTFWDF